MSEHPSAAVLPVSPDPALRRVVGPTFALAVAVAYTAGMGLIWLLTRDGGGSYPSFEATVVPIGILALLTVGVAWWARLPLHASWRIGRFGVVLVVLMGLAVLTTVSAQPWSGLPSSEFIAIVVGALFVGIGEETAYRGLVLNGLMRRMTAVGAVFVSAALFSLLHSVNVLISPVGTTAVQLVMTFLFGLLVGWVYLLSGRNLILVIAYHWLWDVAVFSAMETSHTDGPSSWTATALTAIAVTTSIVVTVMMVRRRRSAQPLG